MENIESAIRLLEKWGEKSKKTTQNGSLIICHVPHVAPEAWFHELYKGLDEETIYDYEKQFPVKFPRVYREFLRMYNGINIFSDSLRIWGLRRSYERTGEGIYQPYELLLLNSERPKGCPASWLFFGSYRWDGSRMTFDTAAGIENRRVFRVAQYSTKVLNEWDSFEKWLSSEVERLSKMYDENGVKLDKKAPTTP
jgi:hypothetical protein